MQDNIENLRKKAIMRAQHRGIKEMDIILGGFVSSNINNMSVQKIEELDAFMSINDQLLYQAILGNENIDKKYVLLIDEIREYIDLPPLGRSARV